MESRTINQNNNKFAGFFLNKDKNIGRVIYIVEGERTELNLLKHLYTKILEYNYVEVKRKVQTKDLIPVEVYTSNKNKNSEVYVINSKNSNISSITTGEDYLDYAYQMLFEKYQLEAHKASVYYLFDRDRESNKDFIVKDLIIKLQNALDNGIHANGLLLLSYPSVEAFIISCFERDCDLLSIKPKKIKTYVYDNKYLYEAISSDKISNAYHEMVNTIKVLLKEELTNFDSFWELNLKLFKRQEKEYRVNSRYTILSLLLASLLDLGIINTK